MSAAPALATAPLPAPGWRNDIQALRGLAVSLVVLEHALPGLLPGGFLGVDIFFVVSGYLMTRLILERLDSGTFSFRDFYARRARRLLPAAYATIIGTLCLAPILIDPFEFRELVFQAAGAFTFTANLVLWRQTDYFGSGAALKPLLHLWSLSVEEQYFLLVPAALVLTPQRLRLAVTAAAVMVSAALCVWFVERSPSAAFYFLPFRAWELGLGSMAAMLVRAGWTLPRPRLLALAAAATLLAVPLLAGKGGHPGLPALAVCLATAAILMAGETVRSPGALAPLIQLGDRSYSLYLVHWPVFAFANNLWLTAAPAVATALLLVLCLALAEAQYRLVETPFRRSAFGRPAIAAAVLVPAAALGVAFSVVKPSTDPAIAQRAYNLGLGPHCVFGGQYEPSGCDSAVRPGTLIWGDSFAIHLVDGLAAVTPSGVRQATKVVCGPFLGLAPIEGVLYRRLWAEGCLAFNEAVMAHLRDAPEIRTVVLASAFTQYLPDDQAPSRALLRRLDDGALVEQLPDAATLTAGIERTVSAIRGLGREVVLMGPPPAGRFDIARCLSRIDAGLPVLGGGGDDCSVTRDELRTRHGTVHAVLDAAERAGARVIRPDRLLCSAERCAARLDGVPLYQDASHLSRAGSKALAEALARAGAWAEPAR